MELASKWIRDCAKHGRCKDNDEQPLPTRILEIGGEGSQEVVLREPVNQRGRYICLSYCWGKDTFISTTRENIEDHKKEIPFAMLPPTFQDAIEVTRRLGVRYLWIDALCIVQDDRQDWEGESGKMADVYHNSFITIAATSADSPKTGCFSASPTSRLELGSVYAQLIHHFPNSPIDDGSSRFPLLTRAWAYQERMLAPRVIHLGREELVWECFSIHHCECGAGQRHLKGEVSKSRFFDAVIQPGLDSHRSPEETWRRTVIQYSPLALSVPSDKLPALSGLAQKMRSATNQTYIAGLWERTLPLDLLWYREEDGTLLQPNLELAELPWRAPSWSWASVDVGVGGEILFLFRSVSSPYDVIPMQCSQPFQTSFRRVIAHFHISQGQIMYNEHLYLSGSHMRKKVFCEVLQVECTTAGQSATGEVTAGFIKLACSIRQVSYHHGELSLENQPIQFGSDSRTELGDGVLHIVRMAQFTRRREETYLVLKAVDASGTTFVRVGLAWSRMPDGLRWQKRIINSLVWPEKTQITII
jgi:hypothetical protein